MRFSSLFPTLLLLMLGWPTMVAADYSKHPEAVHFADQMAEEHGFARDEILNRLAEARRLDRVLELISRPAEKELTWGAYRDIFLDDERIRLGRAFLQKHAEAFRRAEEVFGVSRYVVAAILGVETRYGRTMGSYRVIDALTTLSFDYPPRSPFFRGQLAQWFLLLREQEQLGEDLKGSYAGAVGFGQFIPGSYRHFARDFDGDGTKDLIGSPVDAIGSVAHYLAEHGWESGAPIASRQSIDNPEPALLTPGLKPSLTLADYRRAGLEIPSMMVADTPARLIELQVGDERHYWLTYPNFYVITRYNHSHLYAMAVMSLARALDGQGG